MLWQLKCGLHGMSTAEFAVKYTQIVLASHRKALVAWILNSCFCFGSYTHKLVTISPMSLYTKTRICHYACTVWKDSYLQHVQNAFVFAFVK